MKVDHIGYLCSDMEKSIREFEQLGYVKQSDVYLDNIPDGGASRDVYICFLKNEQTWVELVSPMNEQSDVFNTLKRQGEGPYHICYQAECLETRIEELRKSGWMLLKRPAKAIAFQNARVAFLFRYGVGMIELVETKE